MPKIPRSSDDRVSERALPGVGFNVNPGDAFGVDNPAKIDRAVQGNIKVMNDIIEQEKNEADQIVQLDAGERASQFELQWNDKMRNAQGKDAFGLGEQFNKEWAEFESKTKDELVRNDRQGIMVGRIMNSNKSNIANRLATHQFAEKEKYYLERSESFILTDRNVAIDSGDPLRVGESIGKQKAVVEEMGKKYGWSNEKIAIEQAGVEEKTHLDMINSLKQTNPALALSYYDENKESLPSVKREIIVKDIEDLQKAKDFEARQEQADGDMDLIMGLAGGQKKEVDEVVAGAVNQKYSPEVAQAYVQYFANPTWVDRNSDLGVVSYADELFKSKDKAGVVKSLVRMLKGDGSKKVSPETARSYIMSAGKRYTAMQELENGNGPAATSEASVFDAMWKSFSGWVSSMKMTPEQEAAAVAEWIGVTASDKPLPDMKDVSVAEKYQKMTDEVKKSVALKNKPELANYPIDSVVKGKNGRSYKVVKISDNGEPLFELVK